ncbi:ABC transporter permease [Bifidobacterium sp.]|uniref:ABC transporter permease n=1 Tax=Bifidobacterium sp. TaxID=41200 RepID=UPI0039EA647F
MTVHSDRHESNARNHPHRWQAHTWRTRASHGRSSTVRAALTASATVALLLGLWQLWVSGGSISPRVLSSPSQIADATVESWSTLLPATMLTAYEGFLGFIIAVAIGMVLGIAMFFWRSIHDAAYPLLAIAQTIPLITIAPLFIIWFGFEPTGKVIITAAFALFPITVQTYRGLMAVPRFYEDVALTCGATPWWTLWHVTLRVAARQIFSGLRISAAYVFSTAATAEYLGARNGLGIWLQAAFNSFRTPLIFAATFVIALLTALLLGLISMTERLCIGSSDE